MFGRRSLQLFLQIELHLRRRVTLRGVRDAFEHSADLILDEAHDCLVRDAGPARLLRPGNICAGRAGRSLRPVIFCDFQAIQRP